MKKIRILIICSLVGSYIVSTTSCQRQKGLPKDAFDRPQSLSLQGEISEESEPIQTDPFDLIEAVIEGDQLRVLVEYGGGCATHDFRLVESAPMVRSMPPKRLLTLEHNGHDDNCRALIQEERTFDLTPYRGSPQGLTIVLLDSLSLTYRY